MARVNLNLITAELDDVATEIQSRGYNRLAAKLDMVSNSLESVRVASDPDTAPEGSPPGSQSSVQISDKFDAKRGSDYGPTPIGADSVSAVVGAESVSDILGRLDFAQRSKPEELQDIHVQASKTAAKYEWPFEDITPEHVGRWASAGKWDLVAKAARQASDALDPNDAGLDMGSDDAESLYSTGDLPAAGSEDLVTDDIGPDQKGVLQVFDKTPAGTGEGPGHHGPSAARRAEAILKAAASGRVADDVKVDTFSPDEHFGEGKQPVEEANSLGGMTSKTSSKKTETKTAKITVARPKNVPSHLSALWSEVVAYTNSSGKLVKAGKVDYDELGRNYARVLGEYARVAASCEGPDGDDTMDAVKDDEDKD